MAQQFVEFDLGEGKTVLVAGPATDPGRAALVARGQVVERASQTFREALDAVRPIAGDIFDTIANLAQRPDEVQVELSISLKANAGVVLATVGTEGAIKLVLKWRPH
jgi:hypothetical protein